MSSNPEVPSKTQDDQGGALGGVILSHVFLLLVVSVGCLSFVVVVLVGVCLLLVVLAMEKEAAFVFEMVVWIVF